MSSEPVLLHICCGPCAAGVAPALRSMGFEVRGLFSNPNIHPAMEWVRRIEALESYARVEGLPVEYEPAYGLARFLREAGTQDGPARCATCFAMRLGPSAERAAQLGIRYYTTTLLVSPYQDHELVRRVGESAADAAGVEFLYEDFRSEYQAGQARAKELELYRQPYCGCLFSEQERYEGRLAKVRARLESPP